MPRPGPSKVPIYIALTAFGCFGVGLWLSAMPAARLPAFFALKWQGLGIPGDPSDAMFYAGMLVAMPLVVSYVAGMGTRDPRRKRFDAH